MAFPTTSTLDDFNRADAATLGANWTNPVFTGDGNLQVVSNQCNPTASWCSDYWNPITPGPDSEVIDKFISVTGGAGAVELVGRINNPNSGTCSGYLLDVTGSTWTLWKIVGNVQTQLGASATQAISANDLYGLECLGSAISAYVKVGAGSWTQVMTRTEGTNTGAGRIGKAQNGTITDDFGGGTVITGGVVLPTKARILSQAVQRSVSRFQSMRPNRQGIWVPVYG